MGNLKDIFLKMFKFAALMAVAAATAMEEINNSMELWRVSIYEN